MRFPWPPGILSHCMHKSQSASQRQKHHLYPLADPSSAHHYTFYCGTHSGIELASPSCIYFYASTRGTQCNQKEESEHVLSILKIMHDGEIVHAMCLVVLRLNISLKRYLALQIIKCGQYPIHLYPSSVQHAPLAQDNIPSLLSLLCLALLFSFSLSSSPPSQ